MGETDGTDPSPVGIDDREHLRTALVASRTGVWRWDRGSGVVEWDQTMEELCGLEPGAFAGDLDAWRHVVHADDRGWVLDRLRTALERPGAFSYEHRVVWPDGTVRWLEFRGQVVAETTDEASGTIGCAFDVTERKALEAEREALIDHSNRLLDRLGSLQRLSGLLAGASSVDQVARVVVDELGSVEVGRACALWILDDDAATLELVASHGIPDDIIGSYRSMPLSAHLPGAVAVRERRIVRSDTPADATEQFPALDGAPRSTQGFLVVPLLIGDRGEGALVVGFDDPDLAELDVSFLRALGGHVAQSVARARIADAAVAWAEESAVIAERERRRREQVEFISNITSAALAASDVDDLMARLTRAAVPRLGDWCLIHFLPDGEGLRTALAHTDPERERFAKELGEQYPLDLEAPTGAPAVIRTGTPEFHGTIDAGAVDAALAHLEPAQADTLRAVVEQLGLTSSITVPLVTRDGVIGSMQFVMAESDRHYEDDDLALAEATAGRVADALHAVWVAEQHRATSEALQRALLPPRIPPIPGLNVTCRYWPGGVVAEVGGDFYDVFELGGGRFAVAIGDVCGTGADAAAVTSIARHTIRAAARHGIEHAGVVEWVNQALIESDRERFCTLCFATVEPRAEGGWLLRSTNAGHPLPVVRRAGGHTETVGAPGTLLGSLRDVRTTITDTVLGPGDAVVLYTDGLTDLPPPHGADDTALEALLSAAPPPGDPNQIADVLGAWLDGRVPAGARLDDVALIAFVVE